jgi:peptide/nickel transport system substrate-binding protein
MRLLLAAALCATALAACSKGGSAPSGPADELRFAAYAEPHSLNPLLASNTSDNFLASLAFDELVTLDDRQREVPDLAVDVPTTQNGGISKDGMTVTYKLRRNVKWQDGAPFTSADVKFSWQAVMNPRNNVSERRGYDQVASVDTPDPYTVVFHLKNPFAPFVGTVFAESDDPYRIVPKHRLDKYPDLNQIPFNSLPVGTGPFKVTRWLRGDRIEYVANPDYFRGRPKIGRLVVEVITDMNTQAAEMQSHQIDVINDLTASKYRDLRNAAGVRILLAKSPAYNSLALNLAHPPLDDLRVRQAIAYAIDKRRLIDDLEYGTATPAKADLSDFYWAFDPSVPSIPYDPAKAKQLLDAAGWRVGPSGIRSKNGVPLSLQLVYGQGSETARALGLTMQSDLRAVGIDTPIKTYLYSVYYATSADGGILNGGKFDLAVYSWISGGDPDNSSQWMCSQVPPSGNNISRYCTQPVDAAERVALTNADRSARKSAYSTIEHRLAADVPAVFLFYSPRRYAVSDRVGGFSPNGVSEGWNAADWTLGGR